MSEIPAIEGAEFPLRGDLLQARRDAAIGRGDLVQVGQHLRGEPHGERLALGLQLVLLRARLGADAAGALQQLIGSHEPRDVAGDLAHVTSRTRRR